MHAAGYDQAVSLSKTNCRVQKKNYVFLAVPGFFFLILLHQELDFPGLMSTASSECTKTARAKELTGIHGFLIATFTACASETLNSMLKANLAYSTYKPHED